MEKPKEIRQAKFRRPTLTEKKAILESIYKGDRPAEEILKECNIKTPVYTVLRRWGKQLKQYDGSLFIVRRNYTTEFKQDLVRQVGLGAITEREAILKYNLAGIAQIRSWIRKYSSQIIYVAKNTDMIEAEKSEVAEVVQRNRELEKALEHANFRIIGLDAMIDVAEKQFKIEIRKKAGTKQ
jgi:transposase-like protein